MSDCFFCCIQSMCHVQTKNIQFWLWKGLGSCYISDSSCTSVCWTRVHCQSCQTTAAGNNLFLHNPVSGLENYFISHYLTSHWPGGCELLLLLKKKKGTALSTLCSFDLAGHDPRDPALPSCCVTPSVLVRTYGSLFLP